jgi:hypothetical protein
MTSMPMGKLTNRISNCGGTTAANSVNSNNNAMKKCFLFLLPLLLCSTAGAQELALGFEGTKDCNLDRYCVEITLQAQIDEPVHIGTSSLLLYYNTDALAFYDYTPAAFDAACDGESSSAWAAHQYDAYSKEGTFSLTLLLDQDGQACPSVVADAPISVGTLCFDVQQQGGAPDLIVDQLYTHFNRAFPNNGQSPVLFTSIDGISGSTDLACDCPGAGQPCDDQNVYTVNDQFDMDCNCKGEALDTDGDGIVDGIDNCLDLAYEAEDGANGGVELRNNQPQFYGSGFVRFTSAEAEAVDFAVQATSTGTYTLSFRYSSINTERHLALSVDGAFVQELDFPETASWADWQTIEIQLPLTQGAHTIRLSPSTGWGPFVDRMVMSICGACINSGMPCNDGDPCTVDDVVDRDCNCGGRIIDRDGDQIADDCDPHVGNAEDFPIETGILMDVGDDWQTITLNGNYDNMIVVATPHLLHKDMPPVVTRVRNANGNQFDIRIQNPSVPITETYAVYYIVAEAGVYQSQYDGIKMEARLLNAEKTADSYGWGSKMEARSYRQYYENPVVLGQVMSDNNERWSVFWASSFGNAGQPPHSESLAAGKHKGEDSNSERLSEAVGMIVVEAGTYELRGRTFEAGVSEDIVRGPNNSGYTHGLSSNLPKGAVLSAAGMDGGNGYWPVLFGQYPIEAGSIRMVADEDQFRDQERGHTTEQVAYLAFDASICRYDADQDGVCDAEDQCPGNDDLADMDEDGIPDACDDCNDLLIGKPCDDGIACTILDVYTEDCGCAGIPMDSDGDGVCNWDDLCENGDDNIDEDGDGIPDACDPNVGDATTLPIETGRVTAATDGWQTIELGREYESMVVVATASLPDFDHPPVVTRIRNAEGNQFELRVQNPSGPINQSYDVYYIVIEEGRYRAEFDGVTMEARRMSTKNTAHKGNYGQREEREYLQSYNNPVVLGQLMSANDDRWSVFWASRANNHSEPPTAESIAMGRHIAGDTITERSPEVLGAIVIEAGDYELRGIGLQAGLTPNEVGGRNNELPYNINLAAPNGAVLSVAGINGGDGHWPVLYGATPFANSTVTMVVDEDQIEDEERWHTNEEVAFIAFDDSSALPFTPETTTDESDDKDTGIAKSITESQVPTAQQQAVLKAYPNPVFDKVTVESVLGSKGPCTLQLIDGQGRILLTRIVLESANGLLQQELDLSQVKDGFYVLRLIDGDQRLTVRLVKMGG